MADLPFSGRKSDTAAFRVIFWGDYNNKIRVNVKKKDLFIPDGYSIVNLVSGKKVTGIIRPGKFILQHEEINKQDGRKIIEFSGATATTACRQLLDHVGKQSTQRNGNEVFGLMDDSVILEGCLEEKDAKHPLSASEPLQFPFRKPVADYQPTTTTKIVKEVKELASKFLRDIAQLAPGTHVEKLCFNLVSTSDMLLGEDGMPLVRTLRFADKDGVLQVDRDFQADGTQVACLEEVLYTKEKLSISNIAFDELCRKRLRCAYTRYQLQKRIRELDSKYDAVLPVIFDRHANAVHFHFDAVFGHVLGLLQQREQADYQLKFSMDGGTLGKHSHIVFMFLSVVSSSGVVQLYNQNTLVIGAVSGSEKPGVVRPILEALDTAYRAARAKEKEGETPAVKWRACVAADLPMAAAMYGLERPPNATHSCLWCETPLSARSSLGAPRTIEGMTADAATNAHSVVSTPPLSVEPSFLLIH